MGNVQEPLVDDRPHVPKEERQEKCSYVGTIHVCVAHQNRLVIANPGDVEILRDPRAKRGDERPDLRRGEHLVQPRLLDVQDLSAQRQDRLRAPVAALLGRTAGAVSFDDEELRESGVLFLAVRELAGQRAGIESALAPHELARLARRFPRPRGLDDLVDDAPGDAGVFLEVRAELLVDHLLDPRLDLGRNELVLRLRRELRIADLHGHDGGQALPAVVARKTGLLQRLRQRVLLGIALQRARQSGLESLQVSSAVPVVDGVREREDRLGVSLVPLERDLDPLLVRVTLVVARRVLDVLEVDDLVVDRLLGLVQELDEGPDAPLVGEVVLLVGALVVDRDRDAGVQERELPQPLRKAVEVELVDREDLGVRPERDPGSRLARRAGRPDLRQRDSALVRLHPDLPLAAHLDVQPLRERVHDGDADAVEAARDLVGVVVELPARVQVRHDDLERLALMLLEEAHGDAAAVVFDRDGVVGVNRDCDMVGVAALRLVDGVVDQLEDHVVETGDVVGIADVHPGPLPDGLQALQELDGVGCVGSAHNFGFDL